MRLVLGCFCAVKVNKNGCKCNAAPNFSHLYVKSRINYWEIKNFAEIELFLQKYRFSARRSTEIQRYRNFWHGYRINVIATQIKSF